MDCYLKFFSILSFGGGKNISVIVRSNIRVFSPFCHLKLKQMLVYEKTLKITELTVTRSSILQFIIGFITMLTAIITTRCYGINTDISTISTFQ